MQTLSFLSKILIVAGLCSSVGLLWLMQKYRSRHQNHKSEEDFWRAISGTFFHSKDKEEDREMLLEAVLDFGRKRLALNNAVFLESEGELARVQASITSSYSLSEQFSSGKKIPWKELYCDRTRNAGRSLAIEYAAVSEWRNHKAYRKFQIESYIGVPVYVNGQERGVVAFFDTQPRENFYGKNDHEFLQTLSHWISVVLEKKIFSSQERLEEQNALRSETVEKQNNSELSS